VDGAGDRGDAPPPSVALGSLPARCLIPILCDHAARVSADCGEGHSDPLPDCERAPARRDGLDYGAALRARCRFGGMITRDRYYIFRKRDLRITVAYRRPHVLAVYVRRALKVLEAE
jgi:hypothetical protein